MGAKAGLTLQSIVDEAALLADELGTLHFSISELAARLGVKPPSLYNHVAGMAEIQRLLALRAAQELGESIGRATVGKSRDDAVMAMAQAHRAFIKRRPSLSLASIRAPAKDVEEMQRASNNVLEILLAVMGGYGLKKKRALHVIRAIRSSVHGFASLEVGGGFGLPLDVDESFVWMMEAFVQRLREEAE